MRPLSHIVPAALMELLRTTPMSDGKVGFAWKMVVGPAIERATTVTLEHGALRVDTTDAQWAREVKRSSTMILARMQECLGKDTVTALSVRGPKARP